MTDGIAAAWATIHGMIFGFVAQAPKIVLALIILAAFAAIGAKVKALVQRVVTQSNKHVSLGLVLGRLTHVALILFGVLVAMSVAFPSFKASDVIGVLGIGSVAIGFAFRDILQNFLAGILILLTEPFRVGDQIVISDYEGTVEEIQTRATLLRTYDGCRVVIPNADVFTKAVRVNTAFATRKSKYDVGIGYGDDVEKVMSLLLEAMKKAEGVLPDPAPSVFVVDLAASSVNVRAMWWTKPERAAVIAAQSKVLIAIKRDLTAAGVDMPYPTQQILFHDQTDEHDGDRSLQREGWPASPGEVPRARTMAGAIEKLMEVVQGSRGEAPKGQDGPR